MNDQEIWAYNLALERAAIIVSPTPHVEEERDCRVVAEQIRALKVGHRSRAKWPGQFEDDGQEEFDITVLNREIRPRMLGDEDPGDGNW